MADTISLLRGDAPWMPHDSTLEVQFHYHEVPLIGIVRQHGVEYLFRCLNVMDDDVFSLWHYIRLSGDLRERLEAASTPDKFDAALRDSEPTASVLAVAMQGAGVLTSREVEAGPDQAAVSAAMKGLETELGSTLREAFAADQALAI